MGDEAVDSLVELLNQFNSEQKNDILQYVEEKFERRLSDEINGLRTELVSMISETRSELLNMNSETKTELVSMISATRSEIIKWMFIFWVGQLGVILGILFAFFK
ncbi:hypothetical protein GWO43_23585 [candidate division KSB1 bacterium]|nr:hypothetical protein [candidate division KSB1 bacterium]NIT73798.1 hypothetical protein [candidate division KSB1 bacterium]NIX73478.1 hypothetical protein [candidate division KSB1 bacterium]